MGLSADVRGKLLLRKTASNLVGAYFFPRLETYRFAWRNSDLFSRARISAYAAFSGFDDKNPKSPQLNSFASLQRILERIEDRFHRNFRFHFGDVQLLGNTVYDVLLYHADPPLS